MLLPSSFKGPGKKEEKNLLPKSEYPDSFNSSPRKKIAPSKTAKSKKSVKKQGTKKTCKKTEDLGSSELGLEHTGTIARKNITIRN